MRRLLLVLLLIPLGARAQSLQSLSLAEADVVAAGQIPNPQASLNLLSISPWSGYGAGGWKDKKMDTQLRFDQLIDRAAAARYGLNVMDVQDVIETVLAGKAATELWEGERHFSVVLRLKESERALDRLREVLVSTSSGAQIPLADIVDFKLGSGAMNIARESGQRVLAIGVFIRDRDMGSVVADMQKEAKDLHLPTGYSITWSGEFENQERAMKRLMLVVPLSILLIFVLLFDAFKSFKDALIIICNIPFALIGGVLALLISGIPACARC